MSDTATPESGNAADAAAIAEIHAMDGVIAYAGNDASRPGRAVAEVRLPECRVTDEQLARILTNRSIRTLDLSADYFNSTALTAGVTEWLARQRHLRSLRLNGSDLDGDAAAASFAGAAAGAEPRSLHMGGVRCTDAAAAHLGRAPALAG